MTNYVQKLADAPCSQQKVGPRVNCSDDACICYGTGALVPELRRECKCGYNFRPHCKECQGQGWVLIPAVEQLGVLAKVLLEQLGEVTIGKTGMGPRFEQQHRGFYCYLADYDGVIEGITLEEALAHAICQAQGILKEGEG